MKMRRRIILITTITLCIGIMIYAIINFNKQTISKTGMYFDTVVTITLYDSDEKYLNQCFKMCEKYENLFDAHKENSDIYNINKCAGSDSYVSVSRETLELINKSLYYSRISDGKFDITIGNLADLWGFSKLSQNGGKDNPPDDAIIKETLSNIGYNQISVKGNTVNLSNANTKIDLGGIAKGYIADKLKEYLIKHGVKKGIINLGGNVLLIGSNTKNSNYNIGIQKPFDKEGNTSAIISVSDKSIVTSGVYERYYYSNEKLFHHILDTSTGYPSDNDLLAVTIISDNSTDGDALSTTIFTMGLDKGLQYIEKAENTEAIFINKENKLITSSGIIKTGDTYTLK